MKGLYQVRRWAALFIVLGLSVSVITCSKDDDTGTGPGTKDEPVPLVMVDITTPATDTAEVDTGETTTVVKGVLTNPEYLLTLHANAEDITESVVNDTFNFTFDIPVDTNILVVMAANDDDSISVDTVVFIRRIYVADTTEEEDLSGMAKISGTLLKKGEASMAKFMAKRAVAQNAEGKKQVVNGVIPVTGADIMIYDADAVSTDADTIVKTDSSGHWAARVGKS